MKTIKPSPRGLGEVYNQAIHASGGVRAERVQKPSHRYDGDDLRDYGDKRRGVDPRPLDKLLR